MDLTAIEFDGPLAQRGIGIIAPFDLALERELWRWAPLDVSLHLARTPYEELSVSLAMADFVSRPQVVQTATRDVLAVDPDRGYLLYFGRHIHGWTAKQHCVRRCLMQALRGVTTSGALAEAVRELRLTRIAVITPYDAVLTERLIAFLNELGVAVTSSEYLGLGGGIWRVNYRTVADLILKAGDPEAEASSCHVPTCPPMTSSPR